MACENCYSDLTTDEKERAFPFCELCENCYFKCILCEGHHKIVLYKEKKRSTCLTYQCRDHNDNTPTKNDSFEKYGLKGSYSRIGNMITVIFHKLEN